VNDSPKTTTALVKELITTVLSCPLFKTPAAERPGRCVMRPRVGNNASSNLMELNNRSMFQRWYVSFDGSDIDIAKR
jgi:hypothetical protein